MYNFLIFVQEFVGNLKISELETSLISFEKPLCLFSPVMFVTWILLMLLGGMLYLHFQLYLFSIATCFYLPCWYFVFGLNSILLYIKIFILFSFVLICQISAYSFIFIFLNHFVLGAFFVCLFLSLNWAPLLNPTNKWIISPLQVQFIFHRNIHQECNTSP